MLSCKELDVTEQLNNNKKPCLSRGNSKEGFPAPAP